MDKTKQFRWTKPMEQILLEILADEVVKGNKSFNTFKSSSFVRVAQSITEKFGIECTSEHVENYLRTIKNKWNMITSFRNKSGLGWDDNLKMITTGNEVYEEEVKADPYYKKCLNKKIEMHDEMTLVVGKDIETEIFAKSSGDINMQENFETDYIAAEEEDKIEETIKGKQTTSSTATSSRSYRKRNRDEDLQLELITKQLNEIAIEINKLKLNSN